MRNISQRNFLATWFLLALALAGNASALPRETTNEAMVDAPATEIWAAFTTAAGVESWMVGKASIDLRIGGLMRSRYAKDGVLGDDQTIENTFLSFDAPNMYSMRISKPPAKFPFQNAWKSVWTVVYLEPVTKDTTRVRIRMLGYSDDEESQKMREFFQGANQYVLDQLVKKFRRGGKEAQRP